MGKAYKALTEKDKVFVNEYLRTFNMRRAYLKIYPKAKASTADTQSSKRLKKPKIKAAVAERAKELLHVKSDKDILQILQTLKTIAFADIRDVINWTDEGVPIITESKKVQNNIINQVKFKTRTTGTKKDKVVESEVEFKMSDRLRALDMLAKYHNLWVSHLQVDHTAKFDDDKNAFALLLGEALDETTEGEA